MKYRFYIMIATLLLALNAQAQTPQWSLKNVGPLTLVDDKAYQVDGTCHVPHVPGGNSYQPTVEISLVRRALEKDEEATTKPTSVYYKLDGGSATSVTIPRDSTIKIPVSDVGEHTVAVCLTADGVFEPAAGSLRIWKEPKFEFDGELKNSNHYVDYDHTFKAGTEDGGYDGGWKFEWTNVHGTATSSGNGSQYDFNAQENKGEVKETYTLSVTVKNMAGDKEWLSRTQSFKVTVYPKAKITTSDPTVSTFEGTDKKATFSIKEETEYSSMTDGWTFTWSDDNASKTDSATYIAPEKASGSEDYQEISHTLHYEYNKDGIEFNGDTIFTHRVYKRPKYQQLIDGDDKEKSSVTLIPTDVATLEYKEIGSHPDNIIEVSSWDDKEHKTQKKYEAVNNSSSNRLVTDSVTITNTLTDGKSTDEVETQFKYDITIRPRPIPTREHNNVKIFSKAEHTFSVAPNEDYADEGTWTYQWYRVENGLETEIDGATSAEYTVKDLTNDTEEDKRYDYRARVTFTHKNNKEEDHVYLDKEPLDFNLTVFADPKINVKGNAPVTEDGTTVTAGNVGTQHTIYKAGGYTDGWSYSVEQQGTWMTAKVESISNGNGVVDIIYNYPEGSKPVDDYVIIKATNTYNDVSRDTLTTIKAKIYPQAKAQWNTSTNFLDNHYYGSEINLMVDTIGGYPDGWTVKWYKMTTDNSITSSDIDSVALNQVTLTIPTTTSARETYNLIVPYSNDYESANWVSGNLRKITFTAWPHGDLNGITFVGDSTDVYEGMPWNMVAEKVGGYKDGWNFKWSDNGTEFQNSSDNRVNMPAFVFASDDESMNHTYRVDWKNEIEGDSETHDFFERDITAWHKAEMASDYVMTDNNRGTVIQNAIREGNTFTMSVAAARYGYRGDMPNSWHYVWNGNDGTDNVTVVDVPTISSASLGKTTIEQTYSLVINNFGPTGHRWDGKRYASKTLTVFRKPKTPVTLTKKGNGSSRTLIATADLTDAQLEENEYYLVFGYREDDGTISMIGEPMRQENPGNVRWTKQVPANQYTDDSRLCVYALWRYSSGADVTSGLRFLGQSVSDEAWDGSEFSRYTRGVEPGTNADGIEELRSSAVSTGNVQSNFTLSGMKSNRLVRGMNIMKMADGTTRKVFKK